MLKSKKEGFRSLQRSEMKQIIGGAESTGCPASVCVMLAPDCGTAYGTCGGTNGSCYCSGANGLWEKGCSDTPYWIHVEDPIEEVGSL